MALGVEGRDSSARLEIRGVYCVASYLPSTGRALILRAVWFHEYMQRFCLWSAHRCLEDQSTWLNGENYLASSLRHNIKLKEVGNLRIPCLPGIGWNLLVTEASNTVVTFMANSMP